MELYQKLKETLEAQHRAEMEELDRRFRMTVKTNGLVEHRGRGRYRRDGLIRDAVIKAAKSMKGEFMTNELKDVIKEQDYIVYKRIKRSSSASATLSTLKNAGIINRRIDENGNAHWIWIGGQ